MDEASETERYGGSYWCIKTTMSASGEIYVHADSLLVEDGALWCVGVQGPTLGIARGRWSAFYLASVLDGHAVAVDHWEGEVVR